MINQEQKNILIFRIGSIGDTVIALPCFHLIRRKFPNAKISLLTNIPNSKQSPVIDVLGKNSEFVDEVIDYPSRLSNPIEAVRLIFKLRQYRHKTMVYLMPSRTSFQLMRDKIFFKFVGIENILIMPNGEDQRRTRIDPQTMIVEPEVKRLIRCIRPLGEINIRDKDQWNLKLSPSESEIGKCLVERLPLPFLAIHTGGIHMQRKNEKDWGYERWSELIEQFKEESKFPGLLIVGSNDDQARGQSLAKIWGDGGISICGKSSPRETAAALSNASLFCGHDSGPLHLAQSVGIPTIGLFGNFNRPNEWHPIGSHVSVIHEPKGMNKITVSQVLELMIENINAIK